MKQPELNATLGAYWGGRVKARRIELGLTQAQFASVVRTSQQTISRIEKGEIIPHDKMKLRIAQRTGSKVDVLFAWPDNLAPVGA